MKIPKLKNKYFYLSMIISSLISGCQKEMSTSPDEVLPIRNAVIVTSDPPHAAIYINSKNTGQFTPDTISWVESGDVLITLKLQLFKDSSITRKIEEGDTIQVFMDFVNNLTMRGYLNINSNPLGASVYLNDSALNKKTPCNLTNLLPGYYKIKYKLSGYWDEEEIVPVKSVATTYSDKQLTDTLVWINYTVERTGIPTNYITSLAIEKGYIKWMGTINSGLIRFDDQNWTVYDESNSPVPKDIINYLYIDNEQNLWICTNHGVIKKSGDNWITFDAQNSGLADNRVNSVFRYENKICFGTMKGFSVLDGFTWTSFDIENSPMPSNHVSAVLYQGSSLLWVCTDNGLVKIFNDTWTIIDTSNSGVPGTGDRPTGFPTNNLKCIAADLFGKPWLGFYHEGQKGGGSAVHRILNFWRGFPGKPASDVNFIAVDQANRKWFACFESGLGKMDNEVWSLYNSSNSGLKTNNILSVAVGSDGNKYIASFGEGLIKYKGN